MSNGLFTNQTVLNGTPRAPEPPTQEAIQDEPIDFGSYIRLLRRRWSVAVAVVLLVMVLATAYTLQKRKIYTSEAKLVVVTKSAGLESGSDILSQVSSLKQGRNVDTQVELINSPDLLDKAFVRKLSKRYWVDGEPDNWNAQDIKAGFGTSEPGAWTSDIISRPDTDVIMITTRAYTPEAAAHYANAIANEYEDEDLNRNRRATSEAVTWVSAQIEKVGKQLDDASTELANFQKQYKLVSPPDQATNLVANEVDVQTQYGASLGDLEASKHKVDLLRQRIPGLPTNIDAASTIAANPEFAQVQTQIVQLEGQLTEQSHEFKPNSPEIQQLRNELKDEQDYLKQISRTQIATSSTEANPVRLKLLGDFADAEAALITARDHTDALKNQLDHLQHQLDSMPDDEKKYSRLDLKVELLKNNFSLLSERNATLGIQEKSTLSNVIVAAFARPSKVPFSPKVSLNLAVALVIAVALGVFTAIVLDHLDSRLHQPEEAEAVTGLTALSFIPEATSVTGRLVLQEAEPNHAFLESFRLLRNNLGFATVGRDSKVLAVTSASMSDGKSTTSFNTALAFAKDGKRVLIVDVDLRRPTIHKWVKTNNSVGFTSVVLGQKSLDEAIQPTEWENLWALTSGPLPPDPTEFLNAAGSKLLVEAAAGKFDLVLLDAPPSTGLSDMQVITKMVDGVMVVVALDTTEKPMILTTMRLLRQAGAPLLGVVVNRMKRSNGGSYGNKGYYGYDNYSQDGDHKKKRDSKKSPSGTR